MTVRILAALAAVASLTAGGAFAAEPVTARLSQPVAQKTRFIAGGALFVCEADACHAAAPSTETLSTAACRAVAAKVGPVASFTGREALDANKLAKCNTAAKAN